MKAEASNTYQADLLEKMGFEVVSETAYDSVVDQDCKPLIPIKSPTEKYKIMVKKIV